MSNIVIEKKSKSISHKVLWVLGAVFLVLVISGGYYFFKSNAFVASQPVSQQPVSQQPKNIKITYVTPQFFGYYQNPIVFNCIDSIEYDGKRIKISEIDYYEDSPKELQNIRENCIPF
ncbi:hypothetical protein GA0061081_12018 [Gilliamella bombicola]|uniref:Uncharacterized protein n=1 Tax=Gilliamella bombicola TaxID=1798182 RepID=A0A1C4DP78_9GAMM|nr:MULTISPECIES: hypothetical protein [Gilliamella]NUF28417.1 hypothetical protein [Gilliamella sp. ESL0254]SCC33169.1 hypothetical protein GA0061081_12018 [Gilliamella bombicola]